MCENGTGSEVPQSGGFVPQVQEIVDALLKAAEEADGCIKTRNKAQGRRARKMLSDVKKAITPLRETVLAAMKGETAPGGAGQDQDVVGEL